MKNYDFKMNLAILLNGILVIALAVIGINEIYNKDKIKEKNLVFEIYSARVNCDTVKLKVYNNNTYEYFYSNDEEVEPEVGKYSYDISKIIENNDVYRKNDLGPFILIDNKGTEFEIYDTNENLKEFLESININLDTCLSYEEVDK